MKLRFTKLTLISALLFVFTAPVSADQDKLPFIGKAWFNFMGGNGTNEYIVIKENGDTEIGVCGLAGCSSDYTGKFKKIMGDYTFTSTTVSMVSKSGTIKTTCDQSGIEVDDSYPCTQTLYFDYKNDSPTGQIKIEQNILDNYAYELLGGKYYTNDLGSELWDLSNLVKKSNSKGIKIYCLSYKNICKTETEVIDYFNQKNK